MALPFPLTAPRPVSRRLRLILWAAALPTALMAQNALSPLASPAHNWALDLFTNDGHRSMTLLGEEVSPIDADRLAVKNLYITVFSGDASTRVTSVLLSPDAIFDSRAEVASGTNGVRLTRDDADITGRNWTYRRAGEKISIHGDVRVVLNTQIGDFLK